MIQILWEYTGPGDSHEDRARTLANMTAGANYNNVTQKPVHKPGLDTLTFWGHGTDSSLCGKTPKEFISLVKEWMKENSELKTIEIITCNARHGMNGDSYVKKVIQGIGWSNRRKLTFKGLPVRMGSGGLNCHSILIADWQTSSWCYVTGMADGKYMNDTVMQLGRRLVVNAALKDFALDKVNKIADVAQGADRVSRTEKTREFTLNYGYFDTLRRQLVIIQ